MQKLYTPFYCEENIWHLCQQPQFEHADAKVVFISNALKQCWLWQQRAMPPDEPILWDYHVVLLARENSEWKLWDLDTRLPFPSLADEYLDQTFVHVGKAAPQNDPIFRLVDAKIFVPNFASDRSHMLDANGNWMQPPPHWEAIGAGRENTLMSFINMSNTKYGVITNLSDLRDTIR